MLSDIFMLFAQIQILDIEYEIELLVLPWPGEGVNGEFIYFKRNLKSICAWLTKFTEIAISNNWHLRLGYLHAKEKQLGRRIKCQQYSPFLSWEGATPSFFIPDPL